MTTKTATVESLWLRVEDCGEAFADYIYSLKGSSQRAAELVVNFEDAADAYAEALARERALVVLEWCHDDGCDGSSGFLICSPCGAIRARILEGKSC